MIHRSRPKAGFTIVPNAALQDERLSFAARGMLAQLLSRPDGWDTTADQESERARSLRGKRGEGREAMRAVWRELKDAGYVHLVRAPGPRGRWVTEVHLDDKPRTSVPAAHADVRLTGVPETRTSAPPAETGSSQVAPTYGSPGVGSPAVGGTDRRRSRTSIERTEPKDLQGQDSPVADGEADDEGMQGDHRREGQQPIANSHNPRAHDGPETLADDAHHDGDNHPERPATDRNARASEPLKSPERARFDQRLAEIQREHNPRADAREFGTGPASDDGQGSPEVTRAEAADPATSEQDRRAEFALGLSPDAVFCAVNGCDVFRTDRFGVHPPPHGFCSGHEHRRSEVQWLSDATTPGTSGQLVLAARSGRAGW
jgi:hypothetical protein